MDARAGERSLQRSSGAALPNDLRKAVHFPAICARARHAPLRMVQRTRATQAPDFFGQNEALHLVALLPPAIPQSANVVPTVGPRRCARSGDSRKPATPKSIASISFGCCRSRASGTRCASSVKGQLVFPVTQRRGDFLEERRITTVAFGHLVQASALCVADEIAPRNRGHSQTVSSGKSFQRRLTSTGAGQRNVCRKFVRQIRKVDAHLQHVAIRACAREKFRRLW